MKNLLKVSVLYLICSASRKTNIAYFNSHELDLINELKEFFRRIPITVSMSGMDALANLTEVKIFDSKEIKHRTSSPMLSVALAADPTIDYGNMQREIHDFPELAETPEGEFLISRAQKATQKCYETLDHFRDEKEEILAITAHPLLIQALMWCMQEEGHSEIVRFLEPGEVVKIDFTHDMPHPECIRMHAAIEE